MIKTLLKKQLMELFSFFWQNKKKNTIRTGSKLIMSVFLYLALFAMISSMFLSVAVIMCEPLVEAGMDWLYFALMGLMGVALGAFGSVFNTYASLYQAKDNNMLLAMPVKPVTLLSIRLLGVYVMGLMYEILVMIPVLGVYYVIAKPGFLTIILSILVTLVLSVFILTLSTVLGWVVALISARTKHKSILTVVLSLGFIAAYYYFFGMANTLLQKLLMQPEIAAAAIKGRLYPVYLMGRAAEGDAGSFLMFTALIFALFGVIYFILEKSYRKLLTSNKGEAKRVYREKTMKAGNANRGLFYKELRRFLGTPNYMLNCGLGIVIMFVAAIAILIKGKTVADMLNTALAGMEGIVPMLACAAICMLSSMNDITAPSVSLEGKNIWLLQSCPVSGWQVLRAKLKLHLIMTLIPMLFLTAGVLWVLKPASVYIVCIPVVAVSFVLFMAEFGLTVNLLAPNLNWTNEIIPIKQSLGVTVALFGGWIVVFALCGAYVLLRKVMSPELFLVCAAMILLAGSIALYLWLKKRGAKIFEAL